MDWGTFLREYGLPLTMLGVVLYTGARKVWIWGYALVQERADRSEERARLAVEYAAERERATAELKRAVDGLQAQLQYTEARRAEERESRLAMETRLDAVIPLLQAVTEAIKDVREDLARAG